MKDSIRIMLVDDSPHFLEAARDFLALHESIEVVDTAADGDEALSKSQTLNPDVILLDLNLADRSGLDLVPVFREQLPQVKIIMLTMMEQSAYRTAAMRAGADAYVQKASMLSTLIPAIRALMQLPEGVSFSARERVQVIQEGEQQFRALFENAPIGIGVADMRGNLLTLNDAMLQPGGYSRADIEVLGNVAALYYDPKQRPQVLDLFRKQGFVRDYEIQFKRKDGTPYEALLSLAHTTFNGQPCVQAIVLDITERKRAGENIRQRLSELQVLYETSNAISAEHDLNTLWRAIVENAKKLLNTASSGMYLALSESEDLELTVDTEPYIPLGSRLHFGEGVAGRVAQTRRPLHVDDYSTWEGRSPTYEGVAIGAVLEVPMLYKGELIGVLSADEAAESERKFTEEDEHLLSLFASQAAGAIHSARLREETIQRLSELEVLYQSGLAFSQLVTAQAIAQKIIDLLDQKMDWHHTAIRLYHPETETLELLAFNQPGLKDEQQRKAVEERFSRMVARPGEGLSGWVVQHGVTVRSNDLKDDPRYVETFPGLRAGLYIPIKIAERILGVISIESERSDAFDESDQRLTVTLAAQAAIAINNAQLFEDLQRSNTDLTSAYDATIEGWSLAMDLRDKETEGHTQRVTELTLSMARSLGLKDEEMIQIRRGGLLHDIGKLGVPDHILLKNENLTEAEWETMRQHPTYAHEMLSSISYLEPALDIPYCHHEKWDGTGYPRRLKGEEIPLTARIFAIVDVWDALISDRPYRPAWAPKKALKYIREQSGKHFDPHVVQAFSKLIAKK